MSKEYTGAIAILLVSVLKMFDIEIDNGAIEGFVVGLIALFVAISRKAKGDIDALGRKLA